MSMAAVIYVSDQLEILCGKLAQNIARTEGPSDNADTVFLPEFLITQTAGMESWLSTELARRNGVFANFRFLKQDQLLEDYNTLAIDWMVKESRYDLQYNIYTTAALRHLQCKIKGFNASRDFGGVVYLFVRGIRAGLSSGIYLKEGPQVLGQPFFSPGNSLYCDF